MHFCGFFGLLSTRKSQNDDSRRQSLTIVDKYLKPPFAKPSPHLEFPSGCATRCCSPCHAKPAPKYHTKGCSHSSADSPGARTLVFAAFEPFHSREFRTSIARTPFCAMLWRSPSLSKGTFWRNYFWYHFYYILEYFWISSQSSRKIAFFWEVFGSFCPLGFTLKPLPDANSCKTARFEAHALSVLRCDHSRVPTWMPPFLIHWISLTCFALSAAFPGDASRLVSAIHLPVEHVCSDYHRGQNWETDFYTPPVLRGVALFGNSAPAVYKNPVP